MLVLKDVTRFKIVARVFSGQSFCSRTILLVYLELYECVCMFATHRSICSIFGLLNFWSHWRTTWSLLTDFSLSGRPPNTPGSPRWGSRSNVPCVRACMCALMSRVLSLSHSARSFMHFLSKEAVKLFCLRAHARDKKHTLFCLFEWTRERVEEGGKKGQRETSLGVTCNLVFAPLYCTWL